MSYPIYWNIKEWVSDHVNRLLWDATGFEMAEGFFEGLQASLTGDSHWWVSEVFLRHLAVETAMTAW